MDAESILSQLNAERDAATRILQDSAERSKPIVATELSEIGLRLSVLNGMLGGQLSAYKRRYLEKERDIWSELMEKKTPVTRAQEDKRLAVIEERAAYEHLEARHKDTGNLISVIQTHVRALTEERRGM